MASTSRSATAWPGSSRLPTIRSPCSPESGKSYPADIVILALGVRPDTALAKAAGLEIGQRGGIRVDEHMRTSSPDIFAVGDAVEVKDFVTGEWSLIALAGPANRQGRIAADVIAGRDSRFRGSQGTSIIGLFGAAAAWVGASEKTLERIGDTDYEKIYLYPNSHAGYYPGAKAIAMKVLFRKSDGKLLGAQALGEDNVDKRISALAMALQMGATVYDLEEAELCYAPQFGSAKDPVNFAGMVAADILRGDMPISHWDAAGRRRSCSTSAKPSNSPWRVCRVRSTSRSANCGRVWANCRATGRSSSSAGPGSAPTRRRGCCCRRGSPPETSAAACCREPRWKASGRVDPAAERFAASRTTALSADAMDPLQWLVKGTLVIFVVSSMLSIGLAVQRAQIVAPLRSPAWILRALLANFVLAPVVALSIGAVLTIDPGYELGLAAARFRRGRAAAAEARRSRPRRRGERDRPDGPADGGQRRGHAAGAAAVRQGRSGEPLADRGAAGGADARPARARHGSAAVLRHASAPDCCRC